MQFDITGFLIFLGFILPGFVAQKTRYSLVPRPVKPLPPVGEVGELVLTGVWIHILLTIAFRLYFAFVQQEYFGTLVTFFHFEGLRQFLWNYRKLAFSYFVISLVTGYCFGFMHGLFILKQPLRSWLVTKTLPATVLRTLGVTGFLQEEPVWYFVLKQHSAATMVFLDVEMKDGRGFYTGTLKSYGILDDSVKTKDFYIEAVYFKEKRQDAYVALKCDGVLLNTDDVAAIQVVKIEPRALAEEKAKMAGDP